MAQLHLDAGDRTFDTIQSIEELRELIGRVSAIVTLGLSLLLTLVSLQRLTEELVPLLEPGDSIRFRVEKVIR